MTDDPRPDRRATPSTDPLRALDGATPPERWDEIVDRAAVVAQEDGAPVPDGLAAAERSRRPLLVAAAVLVVVAVAGGLALVDRDDDPTEVVAADRTTEPAQAHEPTWDPPGGLVNREWHLVRLAQGASELEIPPIPEGGPNPVFRVSAGDVSFRACNTGSAPGGVQGDRLVVGPEWSADATSQWTATAMACGPPDGEARMALDDAVRDLLLAGPSIELDGARLTLVTADAAAEFVDPDWSYGDPAEIPDLDGVDWVVTESPCLLGRKVDALTTGWDWYAEIEPGPAAPPVADPGWVAANAGSGPVQGVWSIAVSKTRVEVHVPGLATDDLLGERTEEVDIGRDRPAILWFTDQWVQLRYFPGASADAGPCESFTVTATGADEATNRAGAVAVATSIVTAERDASAPGEESGADPDGGSSSTVPAETEPDEPVGPDATDLVEVGASVELSLDELGVTRLWVLDRVVSDGVETGATPIENGGPDGMGGPPVLDATDAGGDGSFVRGCEVIGLEPSTVDGRPFVSGAPLSGPYPPGGFPPPPQCVDGDQHQLMIAVLSHGVVPALVGTSEGAELVLANEQGTLVFRPA